MEQHVRTLKEIHADNLDVSYQKLTRAVNALEAAGVIHPWRGANNAIQVTLDDGLRINRVLTLIRNQETVGSAVERLIREQLERRIEELQAENEQLRSLQLVEVKPTPSKRFAGWLRKWYAVITAPRR